MKKKQGHQSIILVIELFVLNVSVSTPSGRVGYYVK